MRLLDRTDFVITRWVLTAVAAVVPLFLVVLPLVGWVRGSALTWSGDTGSGGDLGGLVTAARGATVTWDGEAQVRLADAPGGLWVTVLVPQVLLTAVIVAVALLLRHVVGEISADRPFTASSLRALRAVGLLVIGAAAALPFAYGLADSAVMERALDDDQLSLSVDFSLLWLLGGFLVLALGEAFRAGSRLADDVDGLV